MGRPRETNPDIPDDCTNPSRKRYEIRHPKRVILNRTRHRAKKLGIPFSITENDLTIPDVCPVLGYTLRTMEQSSVQKAESPSIDKIKPELGYVPGNVRIISHRANTLKNNATIEELEKVIADLRAVQKEK